MTISLRRWHRWHALATSVIVIASAGSGLLHTLMARTQPPPPATRPAAAVDLAAATVPPSAVAAAAPGPVVSASLRAIGGEPWWQLVTPAATAPVYVHAGDGRTDPEADARYAAEIAGRFLGGATVARSAYLTRFDDEYIAIFRVLPVHRFDADDGRGTRVYVSTMTGSVTRHTDDVRQFEANTFGLLHKWTFIPDRTVRDIALMVAMAGIIALALSGLVLFWRTRPRRPLPSATPPKDTAP